MSETIVNIPRSSLSAGSAIYSVLKDLLGEGHVRPVVSENEVTLPLVTFRRVDARSLDEKGRSGYDEVCYEVVVFAKTYGEGVETMERVRKQLMGRIVASEEEEDGFAMTMDCVKLVGGEESWKDGAFVQTIRLSYHVALGLVKQKMVYEYTLSAAKWGTIIIPFSCAKPDGLKLYEALSIDENGKPVMNEVQRFEANTPYIVGGTPGQYRLEGYAGKHGEKYTKGILTGVYVEQEPPIGSYVLQAQDSGVAFYKHMVRGNGCTVGPYRCYIEPQEGAGDSASMPGGGSSQQAPVKPKKHTLTVLSANESQGSVSGGGTFDDGSTQTIKATPQPGYAFDKWSDGSTQNPRTVKLTSDLTLTASFKVDTTGGGDQGGDETLGD